MTIQLAVNTVSKQRRTVTQFVNSDPKTRLVKTKQYMTSMGGGQGGHDRIHYGQCWVQRRMLTFTVFLSRFGAFLTSLLTIAQQLVHFSKQLVQTAKPSG